MFEPSETYIYNTLTRVKGERGRGGGEKKRR